MELENGCSTAGCNALADPDVNGYMCSECKQYFCNYCRQVRGGVKKIDEEDYSDDDNLQYFCADCYEEDSDDEIDGSSVAK